MIHLRRRLPRRRRRHTPMPTAPPVPTLLGAPDAPAVTIVHGARPRWLVLCDHASAAIPARLADLGLPAAARAAHIAVDIGARAVAARIAARLDATLVVAGYSRLVLDCNRYPWDPASVLLDSDGVQVPGNRALSAEARAERIAEIFLPYHRAIAGELDARVAAGVRPLVLAIHSCTPALNRVARPWPVGVSYAAPGHLARRLVAALARAGIDAGDNQPYSMDLEIDYTAPEHALRRGLPCLQVEFRQDLVATAAGARAWADRFVDVLTGVPPAEVTADPPWSPPWPVPHASDDPRSLLTPPTARPR